MFNHNRTRNALVIAIMLVTPLAAEAADRAWTIYGWADFGQVDRHQTYYYTAAQDKDKQQPAIGLGVRWTSGLTIEAGHIREFDESQTTITSFHIDGETSVETYRTDIATTFVSIGWTWPIGQTPWSLSVNGGVHRIAYDSPRNGFGYQDVADHDVTYGARVDYAINERWRVGLGLNRFAAGYTEYDRSAIRLSYQF